MTPRDRANLEKTLLSLRAQVSGEAPAAIQPARRDDTAAGVPDEDEQALTEMLQVLASNKNRKQGELLAQIDRALGRMRRNPDEAGTCEDCGDDIPAGRLRVMPFATFCAECQAERDPVRGQARRKITDYR